MERLDDLNDREFDVAVDMGCGAGHCLKYLGEHGRVGKIVNLDMSPQMLGRAREAGEAAAAAAKPISDMRGTVEQRKHLVKVLTTRALRGAVERAKGNNA